MISTPSLRQVLVGALAIHVAAGLQPPAASDGGSGAGPGGVQPVSGDMSQDEQDDAFGKLRPTVLCISNRSGI